MAERLGVPHLRGGEPYVGLPFLSTSPRLKQVAATLRASALTAEPSPLVMSSSKAIPSF